MAKDPIEVPDIHRYRERPLAETLDPATVRACIDRILKRQGGADGGKVLPRETEGLIAAHVVLESLLPKPAPESERYVKITADGVPTGLMLTLADIQQRHGLLTPEQATKVAREHFKAPRVWTNHEDELLVALRHAAKQKGDPK